MDVVTITLIAVAVWVLLLGVVVAMCKAAAHADEVTLSEQPQPAVLTPRPAAHPPPAHRIARQA